MPDWRDPQAYRYTEVLDSAQWAWEFLRRNPDYCLEWSRFIRTWRELESAYGPPGERDVNAWQRDPRAWIDAAECRESDCRIQGDRVLIECALGARWGFYKFPPDPADDDPVGGGRLVWRDPPPPRLEAGEMSGLAGAEAAVFPLIFDLSLPLEAQLAQAKRRLQVEQRRRIRQALILAPDLRAHRERLTWWLRLLDGLAGGAAVSGLAEGTALSEEACQSGMDSARQMCAGGYRQLLWLRPGVSSNA